MSGPHSTLHAVSAAVCTWCGVDVGEGAGFRAAEPAGARAATFCRLEHVVPWVIQGAHWEAAPPGASREPPGNGLGRCAHCAGPVGDRAVLLVRHRGEHRIGDAFCGTDHLLQWAKAGGRWQT
jgi:hypothetical protein